MTEEELNRKLNEPSEAAESFNRLYQLTNILRSQEGCPWDKDQTPLSMRRDLMEEVFEAIDAITANDIPHVKEELGDVMFVALLAAVMYEQQGAFNISQSLDEVTGKLVRRHPHVFGEASEGVCENSTEVKDKTQVLDMWDRIKENLEGRKGNSILDQVPQDFPPLLRSYKLLSKAAKKHFDWETVKDAEDKVREELEEVIEAAREMPVDCKKAVTAEQGTEESKKAYLHLEEELGDLLMSSVNLCRMYNVDPVIALGRANRKFYNRFTYVESNMENQGIPMDENHLQEMTDFWNEAKKL